MKKKIVVVGGGTGTYTVLSGLKKYPIDLSVVVSMMDSGGSNRVIRDEFGFLPTSDIRQCIVALASERSSELLRKLFTYRYNAGTGISGMTFGNLFMAALTDIYGSQEEAIKTTCDLLGVRGEIIPVTYDNTNLVALYENGKQVLGEHGIDEPDENTAKYKIVELSVFPKAKANKRALKAIRQASLIVLGPGDLYTSVLPNLVIDGISETIAAAKAKVLFVMNLMTRWGQTKGFTAEVFIKEMEKYLGKGEIDVVLINDGKIPKKALDWYRKVKAEPVKNNLNAKREIRVIRGDFVSSKIHKRLASDILTRSLIRHDPEKLASAIISLV